MRKASLSIPLLALASLAGHGQSAPQFQWGAVLRSDNLASTNPVNALTRIRTNANGDVFISGAFPSNATEAKNFTYVTLNHYDNRGISTVTPSPEGAKITYSSVGFNENFLLYKMNRQGEVQWQIAGDRGNVELHYSPFTPTADGGIFALLNVAVSGKGEFEDNRLLRLVTQKGNTTAKKDLRYEVYGNNTLQGAAAKIDAEGNIEWIKHIIRVDDAKIDGNTAATGAYFTDLLTDSDGNYWIAGRYLKPITFDLPGGGTKTLTPNNVEGWNGDSNLLRGDALLVKLNPQGELLWNLETGGSVEYLSVNSLQYRDQTLYLYGNIAATPGNLASHASLLGHDLYPTDKTNAFSARIDVSGSEPEVRWITLLKSIPQADTGLGRIKITRICIDNGALFLCGSLTGSIEVNGSTILAHDAHTALMAFIIRQDPANGNILNAHLDPVAGMAAEIENAAFRQNRVYAFGYATGTSWLHVYDTDFNPIASHSLIAASGATAWDAVFFDDQLITINRGKNLIAVGGDVPGAPAAFINDDPPAFSAYILAHQLDGLRQETGILTPAPEEENSRIARQTKARIFSATGTLLYNGIINSEKEISLPAGVYIVTVNGRSGKIVIR